LSKGFYIACEDIKPTPRYVVYAGKDTFTMEGGVIAIPVFDLMEEVLGQG